MNDQKNYDRMCKPYDTRVDASAAMSAFLADVTKARQKHRIAEAVVSIAVYTKADADGTQEMLTHGVSLGSAPRWIQLVNSLINTTLQSYAELMRGLQDEFKDG